MQPIEVVLWLIVGGIGAVSITLLPFVVLVSLFKIDEADRYYGVGKLGGQRLVLKWPPFSFCRMTEYGLIVLFSNTHYVRRKYRYELKVIAENSPPKKLRNLLVWLYAIWGISGVVALALGFILLVLF